MILLTTCPVDGGKLTVSPGSRCVCLFGDDVKPEHKNIDRSDYVYYRCDAHKFKGEVVDIIQLPDGTIYSWSSCEDEGVYWRLVKPKHIKPIKPIKPPKDGRIKSFIESL